MKNKTPSVLTPDQYTDLITRLVDHVIAECSADDTEARFDAMIDEIHRDSLTGPFEHLSPSEVMREMCPTDYRCGVADMTGTDDTLREIRGEYYDEKDVESARDSFVADIQSELDDAETGLEVENNLERGETINEETVKELTEKIAILEEQIGIAERYTF